MGVARAEADSADRARRAHVDAAHAGAMFAPSGRGLDAIRHLAGSKSGSTSPSKAGFGGNRWDACAMWCLSWSGARRRERLTVRHAAGCLCCCAQLVNEECHVRAAGRSFERPPSHKQQQEPHSTLSPDKVCGGHTASTSRATARSQRKAGLTGPTVTFASPVRCLCHPRRRARTATLLTMLGFLACAGTNA